MEPPFNSAAEIAAVIADLRAGRACPLSSDLAEVAKGPWDASPVVDATAIYHQLVDRDAPVYLYEDHPCIAPPWEHAAICYRNEHGNVIVMCAVSGIKINPWETAEPVDWDRVRWQLHTFLFIGGRGGTGPMPTTGPVHSWQFAIYDDGTPADLHWMNLTPEYPMEHWDMAHLVLLGALNFMNCRNIGLVEPHRPRAEARRIARTGVHVHTINVFPVGRSTRSIKRDVVGSVPLTSVRGHFATYGSEGRGLLFGKLAGRFWIPQHARGRAELGESDNDYVLRANA